MSDRTNDNHGSFDEDAPAPRSEHPGAARTERRSTRLRRPHTDSYQPHPFATWLSRLWRTLAFRPGVYTGMMQDRNATWQAAVTWILASAGPGFGGLTYTGPVVTGIFQILVASTLALVLWTGVVHVASRILSKTDKHSYSQTVRSLGYSMLPGLGLLVTPLALFSLWGLAMQIHGLREGIGLTWPRAIIAALIPWFLLTGGFFLLLVMACGMGAC